MTLEHSGARSSRGAEGMLIAIQWFKSHGEIASKRATQDRFNLKDLSEV
jgi:hypothetical protein